jgi:hypothetical protein
VGVTKRIDGIVVSVVWAMTEEFGFGQARELNIAL